MCTYGLAALAVAAIGAGVSYSGQQQTAHASEAAAQLENQRQKRIQDRQSAIISKQEELKKKGQQAYQDLQPQLTRDQTDTDQAQATDARNQDYQSAVASVFKQGADPSAQQAASVSVVGDANTPSDPSQQPLAVRNAMADQQARAQDFSSGQAKARAYLDAMGDTQQQANNYLRRGSEKIGMYGDFVSGLNRPLQAWGGAKDASSTAFASGSQAAQGAGQSAQQLGGLLQTLAQVGYGYGTSASPGYAKPVGATGSTSLTSSRPIF